MKVIQIGDNVKYGHRFNGHDLGKYLRSRGINSEHLVWWKNITDPFTNELSSNFIGKEELKGFFSNLNSFYSTNSLFYPFSYDLLFNDSFLDCDVVHLHLIHNGFFGIEHLPIISHLKPVVWTLHDPWAFSGHCIYSMECNRWREGCGECPDLKRTFEIQNDATALNWEYKKLLFQSSDLDIIVASNWMYEHFSRSEFFKNATIHIVNFGIDLDHFKPISDNKLAKRKLGISQKNIVIAFRGTSSIYKGLKYIKACLSKLSVKQPLTLLITNEKGLMDDFSDRFQIVDLGWVDNDDVMLDAYHAADIFLMPSEAEAFGMMAMEAMACGKPVIVMDGTSLPEVIKASESGGIVIPQGDINAFRFQLERLINDASLRLDIGEKSRLVSEKYYSKDRYVDEIIAVYEKAILRKGENIRGKYIVEQQKAINLARINTFKLKEPDFGASNRIISDKEYSLINFLRRVKQIPVIKFSIKVILKPIYRFLRRLAHIFKHK